MEELDQKKNFIKQHCDKMKIGIKHNRDKWNNQSREFKTFFPNSCPQQDERRQPNCQTFHQLMEQKDINLTYNDQQIEVLLKEKAKIRGMAIEIKS